MRVLTVGTLWLVTMFSALGAYTTLPLPLGAQGLELAWAPAGDAVAVVYLDGSAAFDLRLLSVPEGETIWHVKLGEMPVGDPIPKIVRLAFSPDGALLAVGLPRVVKIFRADTGIPVEELFVGADAVPVALGFVRPGGLLAVLARAERWPIPPLAAEMRSTISFQIWNLDWELSEEPVVIGERPISLLHGRLDAFSRDGRIFASLNLHPDEGTWLLGFMSESGESQVMRLAELLGKSGAPTALALSPGGRDTALGFVSGDPAGEARIVTLDLVTGEGLAVSAPCEGMPGRVTGLDFDPKGKILACAVEGEDRACLGLLDLGSGEEEILCRRDPESPEPCAFNNPAFSPDGRRLASLWWNAVWVWELCPEGSELPTPGWTFSYSSGGAYVPTGPGDWRVQLDAAGTLWIAHQTRDETETFGPFQLSPEENAKLWILIRAADLSIKASSTRPGIPDEARSTFRLVGPTCVQEVSLWEGDVRTDPALARLTEELASLIGKYTDEAPRL